jgi:hypothetical protein
LYLHGRSRDQLGEWADCKGRVDEEAKEDPSSIAVPISRFLGRLAKRGVPDRTIERAAAGALALCALKRGNPDRTTVRAAAETLALRALIFM